jgi:hypothetical protein
VIVGKFPAFVFKVGLLWKPAFLYISNQCFPNLFARGPVLALKYNHIVAHVNTECLDDRYPKLKMYISEMNLGSYKWIPTAYTTMHSMVLPKLNLLSLTVGTGCFLIIYSIDHMK